MRRMIVFSLTALVFMLGSPVFSGTIYTWTDADGVKRFTNTPPPDDAKDVQTMQELQDDQVGVDPEREAFDRMVEDAGQSADRYFEEQAEKKDQDAQSQGGRQQQAMDRRVAQERAALQAEIDALEGRALSRTFSLGMKKNLIQAVQEKIDQLEDDPEAYFGN